MLITPDSRISARSVTYCFSLLWQPQVYPKILVLGEETPKGKHGEMMKCCWQQGLGKQIHTPVDPFNRLQPTNKFKTKLFCHNFACSYYLIRILLLISWSSLCKSLKDTAALYNDWCPRSLPNYCWCIMSKKSSPFNIFFLPTNLQAKKFLKEEILTTF